MKKYFLILFSLILSLFCFSSVKAADFSIQVDASAVNGMFSYYDLNLTATVGGVPLVGEYDYTINSGSTRHLTFNSAGQASISADVSSTTGLSNIVISDMPDNAQVNVQFDSETTSTAATTQTCNKSGNTSSPVDGTMVFTVGRYNQSSLNIHIDYDDNYTYRKRFLPTVVVRDENGTVVRNFYYREPEDVVYSNVYTKGIDSIVFNESSIDITIDGLLAGWTYSVEQYYNSTLQFNLVTNDNLNGTLSNGQNNMNLIMNPIKHDSTVKFYSSGDYDDLSYDFIVSYAFSQNAQIILPKSGKIKYHGAKSGEIVLDTDNVTDSTRFFVSHLNLKGGDEVVFEDTTFDEYNGMGFGYIKQISCSTNSAYFYGECPTDDALKNYIGTYFDVSGNAPSAELKNDHWVFIMSRRTTSSSVYKYSDGIGIDKNAEFKFKMTAGVPSYDNSMVHPVTGSYAFDLYEFDGTDYVNIGDKVISFDSNGVGYFTLKSGQYIEAKVNVNTITTEGWGRPFNVCSEDCFVSGTVFDVEEVDDSYRSELTREYNIFRFTNYRIFDGELEIINNASKDSSIKIKLSDGASDIPMEYNYTGSKSGKLRFLNGVASIDLAVGESITIHGLPIGAKFEISDDDYSFSYDNQKGAIKATTRSIIMDRSAIENPKTGVYGFTFVDYMIVFVSISGLVYINKKYKKVN